MAANNPQVTRILIAEDSPTQAQHLRILLEHAGFNVTVAPDGQKGLDQFRAASFDLVITDILMPGLSGYELCRNIKKDPVKGSTPVILLTSLADPINIINGLECGADNFIIKPYQEDYLIARVRTILDHKTRGSEGRIKIGAEVIFLGQKLTINSDKEQILNLLVATFEDVVRANRQLEESQAQLRDSKAQVEKYARQLEGQVRISDAKYQRLMAEARDAIFLLDTGGKVLDANRRAEQMLGEPAGAIVGSAFRRFVLGVHPRRDQESCEELLTDGTRIDNLRIQGAKGRGLWVDYSASVVEMDHERIVLAIVHDVTQRKLAEEALEASERRFQAFMSNSPATAFMKDTDGRYVYVNEPVMRRFPEILQWLGKKDSELWPEAFASQYRSHDTQVLDNDQPLETVETAPARDGELSQWMVLKFPIDDGLGHRFLGGMGLDITERRRTEEALRKSEEQLRQVQKMEAFGQLAGGVAHDFNNLLTIINGYSELLLSNRLPPESSRGLIEEIQKAGNRAAGLTRQLLAFTRQQVFAPKILDLGTIVSEMGKMLQRLIGEDIQLSWVLHPAPLLVKVDAGQIEQIIMNLTVNARDAMPQGGKLTIETAATELDGSHSGIPTTIPAGHYAMLAVSDSGCGMDAATKSRIFEPFFTTKEVGKGTGLGLATVYGIVKQSGGFIFVYSEKGFGSTFKVYLPLVDQAGALEQPASRPPTPATGTETLLLVEDEEGVRLLTRHVLEMYGYTVLEAGHAAEAIRIFEHYAGPIHLIVSDVVMPGMAGRQLAEHLTRLRPGIKVLYLSGYTDDAVVRHGVLAAETAFLQKPFTHGALAQKVREVLDR